MAVSVGVAVTICSAIALTIGIVFGCAMAPRARAHFVDAQHAIFNDVERTAGTRPAVVVAACSAPPLLPQPTPHIHVKKNTQQQSPPLPSLPPLPPLPQPTSRIRVKKPTQQKQSPPPVVKTPAHQSQFTPDQLRQLAVSLQNQSTSLSPAAYRQRRALIPSSHPIAAQDDKQVLEAAAADALRRQQTTSSRNHYARAFTQPTWGPFTRSSNAVAAAAASSKEE